MSPMPTGRMTSSHRGERARSPPVSVLRLPAELARRARTSLAAKSPPEYSSSSARGEPGPVVVLANAAEWKQRFRVGEGPAPAIEADQALQVGGRFALNRLAIECRGGKPLQPFPAPRLLLPRPHTSNDTPLRRNPKLLGLPAQLARVRIRRSGGPERSPNEQTSPMSNA